MSRKGVIERKEGNEDGVRTRHAWVVCMNKVMESSLMMRKGVFG